MTSSNPVGRFMVAAGALIEHQPSGKILLIQRAQSADFRADDWELVYGRLAQGESIEAGLRREVQEEVSITELTIVRHLSSWHVYRGDAKAENEVHGFTYHCQTKDQVVKLSHEHQAYQWLAPDQALALATEASVKDDIQQFIEFQTKAKQAHKPVIGRDVIGVGVGALIFNQEGKILLAQRGPLARNEAGLWEIPGGAVEYGETFEQALKREVKEELGIEIVIERLLTVGDHLLPDEAQHWVAPTYVCRLVAGIPQVMEPDKCIAVGWYSLAEAQTMPLSMVTKGDVQALVGEA